MANHEKSNVNNPHHPQQNTVSPIGALAVVYLVLCLLYVVLSRDTPQAQRVPPAVTDVPPQRQQAAATSASRRHVAARNGDGIH